MLGLVSDAPTMIAYVTDLEGQWARWIGFVARNALVRMDGESLVLADGAIFVFGGDAVDRGPASRRICTMLLDAKRRYEDRVILLAGNRDVNKLRLVRELGSFVPTRAPEFARESRPALLRWILASTMGAAEAFAFRADELAENGDAHDDAAVVESLVADLEPRGLASQYLAACQLAYLHGRTLFVHGGLSEQSLGHVPGREPVRDLVRFVDALNAFYRDSIEAFVSRHNEGGAEAPWQALVSYQAPTPGQRSNEASVVYGRLSDANNNPFLPARTVVDHLRAEGVARLVLGHTPSGDTPSIVRSADFELVVADNSRSRVESGASVIVAGDQLHIQGSTRLDDGTMSELHAETSLSSFTRTGLRDASGALLKGELEDGRVVLYRGLPEYRVEQRAIEAESVDDHALVEPWEPPKTLT